jgi:hypothetical protein
MNLPGQPLTEADFSKLERESWISRELAEAARLRRADSIEGAEIVGRNNNEDYSGIIFPYFRPGQSRPCSHRLRRDNPPLEPDGKPRAKYMCPPGESNHFYFPPGITPEMLADSTLPIIVVEGEKKALASHRLASHGIDHIRWLTIGLSGVWNWKGTCGKTWNEVGARVSEKGPIPDWALFPASSWKARTVYIIFDNDYLTNPSVRAALRELCKHLDSLAAKPLVIDLPAGPEKGVDDFIAKKKPEAALELIGKAKPIEKPSVVEILHECGISELQSGCSVDDVGICLQGLAVIAKNFSPLDRALTRSAAREVLKKLKIQGAAELLETVLSSKTQAATTSELFEKVESWPEEVDGSKLLSELCAYFRRFAFLPSGADVIFSLWIIHSYCFKKFGTTPYLNLCSPMPRCGKTLCLELLESVCNRPLQTSNASTAAVFRSIEKFSPSLLFDEVDQLFKGTGDEKTDLIGVLNSGFRAGGSCLRCVGDNQEPTNFSTYSPKILCGIGSLPGTLADRSIIVQLCRKPKDVKLERFSRIRVANYAAEIKRKITRWVADRESEIENFNCHDLPFLNDRQSDGWLVLRAIADTAGGDWLSRCERAAYLVAGESGEENVRLKLLALIKAAFADLNDRISSENLCEFLSSDETSPFQEWKNGKPISPAGLARLLISFKIKPRILRAGENRVRGYFREDFAEVFNIYLPDPLFSCERVNKTDNRNDCNSIDVHTLLTPENCSHSNVCTNYGDHKSIHTSKCEQNKQCEHSVSAQSTDNKEEVCSRAHVHTYLEGAEGEKKQQELLEHEKGAL